MFWTDSAPQGAAAPPLVLIHGAGGTHRHWGEEIRALPGRRVVALDLPGHGRSPGPAPGSIGGHARSVLAALDGLGLASAALAGSSMGGAIAMTLALEAPARVAGLVLVSTGARLRVSPALLQATADPAAFARAADGLAEWLFGPLAPSSLRRELVRNLLAQAPGVAHGDFTACNAFDVMSRLGEIRSPTLVVCGAEDRLTPPRYAAFLHEGIPGARLEVVPGAGHLVPLEAPAEVARVIEAFLASLGPPPAASRGGP